MRCGFDAEEGAFQAPGAAAQRHAFSRAVGGRARNGPPGQVDGRETVQEGRLGARQRPGAGSRGVLLARVGGAADVSRCRSRRCEAGVRVADRLGRPGQPGRRTLFALHALSTTLRCMKTDGPRLPERHSAMYARSIPALYTVSTARRSAVRSAGTSKERTLAPRGRSWTASPCPRSWSRPRRVDVIAVVQG